MKLFEPMPSLTLKNRIVMAPMTRCRAVENVPNDLMATYYAQRADAGLLITEGTAPTANGLGYARIPGIYNERQVAGWKKVTDAVHAKGGKIFVQLMHCGRVSHPDNMEEGTVILAPSAVRLEGEMYTDSNGMQAHPEPIEMTSQHIEDAVAGFVTAAKNAIEAGFDGVELHGANGYLIDQFLNTATNKRTDDYGGSNENRARFAIEVATGVVNAIGADKTAIRLSPYGAFGGMEVFDGIEDQYTYLAQELGTLKLAYVHLVDHSAMGTPEVPVSVKQKIRQAFGGPIIASGGLDRESAEAILEAGDAELTAFGRPFISNPDLVHRLREGIAFAEPNHDTFYTPGPEGYTDYPTVA